MKIASLDLPFGVDILSKNKLEYKAVFELVSSLLDFEYVSLLEFDKTGDCFAQIRSVGGKVASEAWTLVNLLRAYNFEIPYYARILLDLGENSQIEVCCMVVLQNLLQDSKVQFLAPIKRQSNWCFSTCTHCNP